MANKYSHEDLAAADSALFQVGELSMRVAREFRLPLYPDGRAESLSEHSQTLAMVALELAQRFYPELDAGRIALLSVVHDLAEVEATGGDTPTLGITEAGLIDKIAREAEGSLRLRAKYPFAEHLFDLMDGYEPEKPGVADEAVFVFIVDKIVPTVTHAHNDMAILRNCGITTGEQLWQSIEVTQRRLESFRERFPLLLALREFRLQQDAEVLDANQ